jgi:hypothetical protein
MGMTSSRTGGSWRGRSPSDWHCPALPAPTSPLRARATAGPSSASPASPPRSCPEPSAAWTSARLVAFPTYTGGVKAAFETIALDAERGRARAYRSFVHARTGEVLYRPNEVKQAATDGVASPGEAAAVAHRLGLVT